MSQPLVIYAGYIVRYPLGGHVLAELHNLVGLQQLGYEVVFVEEAGGVWTPCYDPLRNEMTADPSYGLGILERLWRGRYCYVDSAGKYRGLSAPELQSCCRRAAFLFSRSRVTWLPEFADCPRRIFVDVDPVFTQIDVAVRPSASHAGRAAPQDFTHHFTYGENLVCTPHGVPMGGHAWHATRPPVVLDQMRPRFAPDAAMFNTVMSWTAYGAVDYEGRTYGQKDVELRKFMDLPTRTGRVYELALAGPDAPVAELRQAGWIVRDAREASLSVDAYCDFIGRARGEFSVAKQAYVSTHCGWFSDRTANYLAMGKPAIVQDTGFSEFLPCGEGLFAFRSVQDVLVAVEEINRDYPRHCRAAHRTAEEMFDSTKVLLAMLEKVL